MSAPPNKKEMLLELLENGLTMLHFNTNHPDLDVPDYLKEDHTLALNLSYKFMLSDLDIQEGFIGVTLSFQRVPYFCHLPFDALWGLSQPPGQNLRLFPDCMPVEILFQMMAASAELEPTEDESWEEQADEERPLPPTNLSVLQPTKPKLVTADEPQSKNAKPQVAPAAQPAVSPTPSPKAPKRPALRLVVDQKPDENKASQKEKADPSPKSRPVLRLVPDPPSKKETEEDS